MRADEGVAMLALAGLVGAAVLAYRNRGATVAADSASSINWGLWDGYAPGASNDEGMGMRLPRGIRNNNPGNIERGANWRGLADNQSDPRFAVFDSPIYGIRALARVISNYQVLYGINTIRGVINRWAPSSENNTRAYVNDVADRAGISPDAPIDLRKTATLERILPAIIAHENGMQPYEVATIQAGIRAA